MLARQKKETADVTTAAQTDVVVEEPNVEDRRLRRLRGSLRDSSPPSHGRHIAEPEIIEEGSPELRRRHFESDEEETSSEEEEEVDEEEVVRRRAAMRERALLLAKQQEEEEMLTKEEEQVEEVEEEESSEYEEYSDSEDETGPRLKPVFVRKNDRITVKERERQEEEAAKMEENQKKVLQERKKESLRIASEIANTTAETTQNTDTTEMGADTVNTDDENDEVEYEAWKVRELKRIKRDREERDVLEKERQEVERVHNLTEEDRERYFKLNPKNIPVNKAPKGKYRFLQKYYHRGVFYLENDEKVLRRDTSAPTLEDHFDKTILPQVMQVKNFGRSGRTKYTHLVDQDTTDFEAAWSHHNPVITKFESLGGGMKQTFQKPSKKKRKAE
jgi:microfibrillar-associated protein 1